MKEKIVVEFTKESILSKKTSESINCVSVEIYAESRPDEYILYRDFKLQIPYSQCMKLSVDEITKDDFNRYVLNGYSLPNAYTYGFKLLLDRINERKEDD